MTQTIQHVRLDEINVLRIICQDKDCGATIEVPLSKAAAGTRSVKCPGCNRELSFGMNAAEDPYKNLAEALRDLVRFTNFFRVELPIKAEKEAAP
jgi:hypothetical protein